MPEIAEILEFIQDSDVFFHFESDHVDWTDNVPVNFIIQSKGQKFEISLFDSKDIERLAVSFNLYTKNCNLLSWNYKNIVSFFKKKSKINIEFHKVYDLRIICSYLGLPISKPPTSKEAFLLFNQIRKTSSWNRFEKFYDEIYYYLSSKVIPDIETNFLVDRNQRKLVYSYYEIDGQSNGRMKNLKILKDCYLPHSMGEIQKNNLRLPSDEETFIYFDFKHMEVSVLEWITKDENLSNILKSGEDLYKSIWQLITQTPASKEQRKICKNVFLPVVFGQGANSLSSRLGISEKNANKLIYKLEQTFPVAFAWVKSQAVDSNNYATDIFGRRRKFQNNELYKIRNFCIQSPSNMICLKKLINLYNSIKNKAKICFHIHDGYAIQCNKKDIKLVSKIAKSSLEEDEDLFPNLKLKISCSFGDNLNELKRLII